MAAEQENYISIIDEFVRAMGASPGVSCNNCYRAPRIISILQGRYAHEKAAELAAEQENSISTIDEIT